MPLNNNMFVNECIKIAYKRKLLPPIDSQGNYLYQPQPIDAVWNIFLSDRSNGKTTAWIIIALIANWKFGKVGHIVRSRARMITEANVKDLTRVIVELGYIPIITDNNFNSLVYKKNHRAFYYANIDENGEVLSVSCDMCLKVASIDQAEMLKSGYNAPTGDIVIFDEFINSYNNPNEFVEFCDLLSTIFRKRMDCYIIMLANTINRQSYFFDDLECRAWINSAEQGDKLTYESGGTRIHIEILGARLNEKRKKYNSRYFGFKNEMLNSITGTGWALTNAQHLTFNPVRVLIKNVFLYFQNAYYQLEILETPEHTHVVFCHKSNEPKKDDAYIYTCDGDFKNPRYIYKYGKGEFDKYIWSTLWNLNRWYYATNTEASVVKAYVTMCNSEKGGGYHG